MALPVTTAPTPDGTPAQVATVWAVNPSNDSLESLVTYTCSHAGDYLKAAGIRCRLEVPDHLPGRTLSATVRHNVFLIVKEALHNVAKHAAADEVTLRLASDGVGLKLVIEDNGRGFDLEASELRPGPGLERRGNGLVNMRARAAEIGGRIEFRSAPGRGTSLQLEVNLGPG